MHVYSQKTWDGGAGTTNWADANNWSPNGVPSAGQDVVIGSGDVVVISSTISVIIDDLTIQDGGSLTVQTGGSLSTDNGGANQGVLTMTNGGVLNITGGTLNIGDYATISSGSIINVSSGTLDFDEQFLADNSTVNVSGGTLNVGTFGTHYSQFSNGSTLNLTGGTYNNQDMYFDNSDFNASAGAYNGDWFQATGTSTIDFTGTADLSSTVLLVVDDSELTFNANDMAVGSLEVQDNASINLTGGTVIVNYLGAFDNSTLNISTTVSSSSDQTWADLYLWDNATINISDGADISGFTDLNMNGDPNGDGGNATLNMTGGSFAVDGNWDIEGTVGDNINITGGNATIPGEINIGSSDVLITLDGGAIDAGSINDTNGSTTSNFSVPINGDLIVNGINLPIELLGFWGEFKNGVIEISWKTGSEINNDYMEVQRSYDGVEFVTIASKDGQGTTSDVHEYVVTDRSVANVSLVYYRLRQFDYDGKNETFKMIAVSPDFSSMNISYNIYPNPASEKISFSVSGIVLSQEIEASLIDLQGKIIKQQKFDPNHGKFEFMDLDQIQNGIYLLRIESSNYSNQKSVIIKH